MDRPRKDKKTFVILTRDVVLLPTIILPDDKLLKFINLNILSDIKVLFTDSEIQARVKEMAKTINFHYGDEELHVICVLKGSIMFTVDLVKYLKMPAQMEFIRLSSYGSSFASSGKVNAVDISLPDLNGKNVLEEVEKMKLIQSNRQKMGDI